MLLIRFAFLSIRRGTRHLDTYRSNPIFPVACVPRRISILKDKVTKDEVNSSHMGKP